MFCWVSPVQLPCLGTLPTYVGICWVASKRRVLGRPTHVCWPESSVPAGSKGMRSAVGATKIQAFQVSTFEEGRTGSFLQNCGHLPERKVHATLSPESHSPHLSEDEGRDTRCSRDLAIFLRPRSALDAADVALCIFRGECLTAEWCTVRWAGVLSPPPPLPKDCVESAHQLDLVLPDDPDERGSGDNKLHFRLQIVS